MNSFLSSTQIMHDVVPRKVLQVAVIDLKLSDEEIPGLTKVDETTANASELTDPKEKGQQKRNFD